MISTSRLDMSEGYLPGGGGGTPLYGLYGDVPLERVWFLAYFTFCEGVISSTVTPVIKKNTSNTD